MKPLLTLLLFVGSFALASAQDKIYLTSGKIIECKVTEVGNEEIKYKVSTEADAAVFAVKKIDVIRIEFANGHVEKFKEELDDPDLYKDNKKNAWKIDFATPLFGTSVFGYERSIRPGFSLEANIGIIGMGNDLHGIKSRGALVKFGPKFMKTPDFRTGSLRYYHVLKGAYIQPQIMLGAYTSDVYYYEYTSGWPGSYYDYKARETTTYGNIMINFGKQTVFANAFLIDVYAGVGYGFANTTKNHAPANYRQGYEYSNYSVTYGSYNLEWELDLPISVTAGIKLGFLTK